MKRLVLLVLLALLLAALPAVAQITAASCSTADVQAAINTATEGQTVTIPAGTCTWASGVTISGKGITVNGAGSARIVAYDTGTLSLQSSGTLSVAVAGFSPGFSGSTFTGGLPVRVFQEGNDPAYMLGTVSSYSGGTLSVAVSSSSGSVSCNAAPCPRWLVATNPATTTKIVNSSSTNPLFSITEDTSVHTNVGNIQIVAGTISQNIFIINYASGGQAVLIHDMWMQGNSNNSGPSSGNATMILDNSPWRGVFWNLSFDGYPFNVSTLGAISIQDPSNNSGNVSWTTASAWGTADTTGQQNVYAETNDYHALGYATSTDSQGRAVFRYSLYDNSGIGTHGADTSSYGQRYIDVYDNTFVFEGYTNGNTYNLQSWTFMRGGSLAFHNNTVTAISSQDYGTKNSIPMTVYNLQENAGPNPCWGATHSTAGQYYHAPRQVGFGYVTGTGTANYPPDGVNNSHTDSISYVGDSEPIYIWGNNTSPLPNVNTIDYGGSACSGADTSANYIVSGRDYFNGSTAKPGYTAYQYPNPLEGGSPPPTGYTLSTSTSGTTKSYSTSFPATENPISQSGAWVNGGTTGVNWGNVQTTPGLAFGTNINGAPPYNDSTAVLSGTSWGTNQTAQGVAYVNPSGFGSSSQVEVELHLNMAISANSITGYECDASVLSSNPYMLIVRWNGPLNNYTPLTSEAAITVANGDTLLCTNVGGLITFYHNGTAEVSVTDTTYTNGSPGVGFWNVGGNTSNLSAYGFSSFTGTGQVGSGTISCSPSGSGISSGTAYSCTVTPSAGSSLVSVTGCGGSGTTTYTGTMPASNCTVTATFNLSSTTSTVPTISVFTLHP